MGRTFAVVPVPVRDTVLGGLTADVDGSRVDLVARLEEDGEGTCYAIDFVARGLSEADVDEAERCLRGVFTVLVRKRRSDGVWHAQGRVALENITSRALRVLGREPGPHAEPWIDIENGIACIHLCPQGRDADEAFCLEVETTLRDRGLQMPVYLEVVDDAIHRRHARCLDAFTEPGGRAVTAT